MKKPLNVIVISIIVFFAFSVFAFGAYEKAAIKTINFETTKSDITDTGTKVFTIGDYTDDPTDADTTDTGTTEPYTGTTGYTSTEPDTTSLSDEYIYSVNDSKATITKYSGVGGAITIPDSLGGYPVTTISYDAFSNCTSLISVIIPDSVTTINAFAFYNCSGLKTITIPKSVATIDDVAFLDCTNLTEIIVDTNNTSYSSLDGVLFNKAKTTLIQFPCGKTGTYVILDSVTAIGEYAFNNCAGLTSVTISDSITEIGRDAFSYCIGLTSVDIPEGVKSIGDSAFSYCTGLSLVTIPKSVNSIGDIKDGSMFEGCSALMQINVDVSNETYSSLDGVLFNKTKTSLIQYPCGRHGAYIIPTGVTIIGGGAFSECSGLTSVTIPDSVTTIGYSAFSKCYGLLSVIIPDKVTSLETDTFYNCYSLTSISIGTGVTYIDKFAFYICSGLTQFNVDENNMAYSSQNGVLFNKSKTILVQCPACIQGDYVIPNGVIEIQDDAFNECHGLTSVFIPDSVTKIGDDAFRECYQISEFNIPDSVASIGSGAFSGTAWFNKQANNGLLYAGKVVYTYVGEMPANTSVEIRPGTKGISSQAFYWCTGLTSITIPDSVTNIGQNAFYNTAWFDNQPDGVIYAGKVAYTYKGEMPDNTELVLNPGTKGIADDAFSCCNNLTSVTIPESVTNIGDNAFSACQLTSVTIPASVTSIGDYAFYSYPGLSKAYFLGNAPTMGENVFYNRSFIVIYVSGETGFTNPWHGYKAAIIYGDYAYSIVDNSYVSITGYLGTDENITIPSTINGYHVTSIGESAFNGSGIKSVTIPAGITTINDYAFTDSKYLKEVNFLGNAPMMGKNVFDDCGNDGTFYWPPAQCVDLIYLAGNTGFTNPWYGYATLMKSDDFLYSIKDSKASVSNYIGTGGNVVIPSDVAGFPVTDIIYSGTLLTSVNIPQSVKNISNYAFDDCNGLTQINVDANNACYSSLEGVLFDKTLKTLILCPRGKSGLYTVPDSVKIIADSAFYDCTGLTSIITQNGVSVIGSDAFGCCTGLNSINIGIGVTTFEDMAFDGCTGLTQINVDADNACYSSFEGVLFDKERNTLIQYPAGLLGNYIIPVGVTTIGKFAFDDCENLTSVTIPKSVKNIGSSGFCECTGLSSITIQDGMMDIGDDAFFGCTGMISITIPDSVTNVGYDAFYNTPWYDNQPDGLVYVGKVAYNYKGTMPDNTSIILEPDTKGITGYAFSYCSGLTEIAIPDSVTNIGDSAFEECTGLASVTIPDKILSIGDSAFEGCTGLTSVTIPDNILSIGYGAFSQCTSLMNITIPDSLVYVGAYAFSDTPWFNNQPDGLIYIGKVAYKYKGTMPANTSIILNSNLKCIADGAFADCAGLRRITIPADVTYIGDDAFSGCTSLICITIPNSVTSIGNDAFFGCTSLTSITIPASVSVIGEWTINGRTNPAYFISAGPVTEFDWGVFFSCDNLTIYCNANSCAQIYAEDNSINYELIHISVSTEGPGCKIDYANHYITGLTGGITSLGGYFDTESGYELSYIPTPNGFGTGTVVNVISNAKGAKSGNIVATYTIVIFGDVNGDGNIDSIDAGKIVDYQNYMITWDPTTDAAKYKAGDLNGDGNVDSIDAGIAVDSQNYMLTIDQSTGLASPN